MYLQATDSTPEVNLTFVDDTGWIRGPVALTSGHLNDLFESIIEHLRHELSSDQGRRFRLEIDLDDIPSTVYPLITNLLDMMLEYYKNGVDVQLTWVFLERRQTARELANTLRDKYAGVLVARAKLQ